MNAQPSQYLDSAKYGEIADKHNALNQDVDKITGQSLEEKESSHELFQIMRLVLKWAHGHRFAIIAGLFGAHLLLSIFHDLGVNTSALTPVLSHAFQIILFGN